MKEVFKQYGIYGNDDIPLGNHFVCIEKIQDAIREIEPHSHPNLFQIQVFTSGRFKFFLKQKTIDIQAPAIVITPQLSLHGFNLNASCEGYVLSISTSLFDELLLNNSTFQEAFSETCLIECHSKSHLEELTRSIEKIKEEQERDEIANELAIRNYFQVAFLQVYRMLTEEKEQILLTRNKDLAHFRNFLSAIKRSFPERKKIDEYARELGITIVHLNRICNKIGKKKAIDILQNYTVVRANWYLSHTEMTVSEIAYTLNFNDPSYFCRFYKRNTGKSPLEFRKKNVQGSSGFIQ